MRRRPDSMAKMMARKVVEFTANSTTTPKKPCSTWPITGPMVRARLKPALFSAIAAGSTGRGTISGTTACQAGPFMALPMPMQRVSASRFQALRLPVQASTVSTMDASIIQTWQHTM
jgi:hypothetical protein